MSTDGLAGTIWLAKDTHDRTTVDRNGAITIKQGKNIYIQFMSENRGVLTAKIHWWNTAHNLNVVEYAVMVPEGANVYRYAETEHPEGSGFPGIQGGGIFRVTDGATAELTQIGNLLDGSASAFVTMLEKVDSLPDVPLPQTYPPIE